MLKHDFHRALRHLFSNRLYSLLNITGLAIGLLVCLIITIWVNYELSFENFHTDKDKIFRFTTEFKNPNGYTSNFARCWQEWTRQMPAYFPEIENMALFAPLRRTAVKSGDIKFYSEQVFRCNIETFEIFDFKILQGGSPPPFDEPGNLLISEKIFRTYFPEENILDSTIEISGAFDTEFSKFRIVGVFKDFPPNSHFHPEILISIKNPTEYEGWAYTYFWISDKNNAEEVLKKFPDFAKDHLSEDEQKYITPQLQAISDIHLYSHKDREIEKNGDIKTLWIFITIAWVIFLLSLINFINIQLALINRKKKDLLIQKILGSNFKQFSGAINLELLLIVVTSSLLSLLLYFVISPLLSDFIPVRKDLAFFVFLGISWIILTLITFVFSFIPLNLYLLKPWSNFFPSITGISNQSDAALLREGNLKARRILIIIQFFISFSLISGTIYIQLQTEFLFQNRMKAETGSVLVIPEMNWSVKEKNQQFKNRLLESPLIRNVTASMEPPSGNIMDAMGFEMEGYANENQENSLYVFPVDDNFLDFFGIPLIAGNNFSAYDPVVNKEEYIINETALKHLGFDDPQQVIGRKFKLNFSIDSIFQGGTITGVVRDFNLSPMHNRVKALVLFQKPIWYGNMLIELNPDNLHEGISYIKTTWDELFPQYYFDYTFTDQLYDVVYENEKIQAGVSRIFTVLALIIASFGLIGMSTMVNQIRSREISIRRILGAFTADIFFMLFRSYFYWIFIAILFAIPVSFYFMKSWAEQFAYRIGFPWWIFIFSGATLLLVALFSVGFQTFKAATKNPVESIRHD